MKDEQRGQFPDRFLNLHHFHFAGPYLPPKRVRHFGQDNIRRD